MSNKSYSVGFVLQEKVKREILSTNRWAEIAVSVNSALSKMEQEQFENYREPVITISSNNYHDILNLLVVTLFIENENVKNLIKLAIAEKAIIKQCPELGLFLKEEVLLKQYLVKLTDKKGFPHLHAKINMRTKKSFEFLKKDKDGNPILNSKGEILHTSRPKNILNIIKLKFEKTGTPKSQCSEPRRIGVGYRDKGNLPEIGRKEYLEAIKSSKEIQQKKEEFEEILENTADFMRGVLT